MLLTAQEIEDYPEKWAPSVQFWLKVIAYHLAKIGEKQREENGSIQVHE